MNIGQLLLADAGFFETKHQRIDAAMLALSERVVTWTEEGSRLVGPGGEIVPRRFATAAEQEDLDVLHLYGSQADRRIYEQLTVPVVASSAPPPSRIPWRTIAEPASVQPASGRGALPEAVEESYFGIVRAVEKRERRQVGSLERRPSIIPIVDQTVYRIQRFRDDIDWTLFHEVPTADELAGLDAWVDPAIIETDGDGFTAEAVAAGLPVIASRTPINQERLDFGRAGALVPPGDFNELAHALLNVLFKPETFESKLQHAATIADRWRPAVRRQRLLELYMRVRR